MLKGVEHIRSKKSGAKNQGGVYRRSASVRVGSQKGNLRSSLLPVSFRDRDIPSVQGCRLTQLITPGGPG
jgi:hypothetical protein